MAWNPIHLPWGNRVPPSLQLPGRTPIAPPKDMVTMHRMGLREAVRGQGQDRTPVAADQTAPGRRAAPRMEVVREQDRAAMADMAAVRQAVVPVAVVLVR